MKNRTYMGKIEIIFIYTFVYTIMSTLYRNNYNSLGYVSVIFKTFISEEGNR